MCFSAMVWEGYNKYCRVFGADISIKDYYELYVHRDAGGRIKTSKAMDAAFASANTGVEARIRALIEAHDAREVTRLESERFTQMQRLNKAVRALADKPTKKAQEDQRIATSKIEQSRRKLEDLRRADLKPRDRRIYPGGYASVLAIENGRKVVLPMRYLCRPAGKPAFYDSKYPGTYNARRDSLEGYWKAQFGHNHAIIVADRFYENVQRVGDDGVAYNEELEFKTKDGSEMTIACLWSRWVDPKGIEPDLLSFAAITDEPEPEVAEAGHDRTIINIQRQHVEAWLHPEKNDLQLMYDIFDNRRHPYYEHRIAA